MQKVKLIPVLVIMISIVLGNVLEIEKLDNSQYQIILDSEIHENYGCLYPLTYNFQYSDDVAAINAYKKYEIDGNWDIISEKESGEYFNGIEAVRVDSVNKKIFVSVAFATYSDTLFLKFNDSQNDLLEVNFVDIPKYYDDRKAVVTATIDDVQGWMSEVSIRSGEIFQEHEMWLTMGIVTAGTGDDTWSRLQSLIEKGYIEAAAHSRTHPSPEPYGEALKSEVSGCKQDIIDNLTLPRKFNKSGHEYVYTWIAPHGYTDNEIDSLLGVEDFLVNRLYIPDAIQVAEWDSSLGHFEPYGMTGEMGNTSWQSSATTDTTVLKERFDTAYNADGVYHVMFHPQSIDWDQKYGPSHLDYIDQRKDVWYVSLGHLYLYELVSGHEYNETRVYLADKKHPEQFELHQNYPNPFNSSTIISFSLNKPGKVELSFYNLAGQLVGKYSSNFRTGGFHKIRWKPGNLPSGVYFYKLSKESQSQTKKLLLQK
ncbi:MAG TPA: T9SS type A sorting domain-containing protein [bacterium]|nr:T9SS type A sorting domain-containing protein [bacterium]